MVLCGPSGCGKTTALQVLAGLEDVDSGAVLVGGRDISGVATSKRDMGMVFQAYSLFYLAPDLNDEYIAVIRGLVDRYYASVTRDTTSAFLRLKLSEQLSGRGLAPHIFESRQEAMSWLSD